jgi:exopolysaccharide production protein ExoZ
MPANKGWSRHKGKRHRPAGAADSSNFQLIIPIIGTLRHATLARDPFGLAGMITNLQVLRAIAALGVVFYHTAFLLPGDWHTEFFGVPTFFVISGFIICFITKDSADGFLVNRIVRIVPLYWLCTIGLVLIFNPPPLLTYTYHTSWWRSWALSLTDYAHLLQSLFFVPSEQTPLLGVGWTLNFEVYFYTVFAAALWINRRFAPLISACVIYVVIKANELGVDHFLIKYYSHGYIPYFLYGIALFYVWTFAKNYLPKWPTVVACIAVVLVSYGSQFVTPLWYGSPTARYYAHYIPVALVAASLFSASAGADFKWKSLILIGDASYAIYLTHTIFMEAFRLMRYYGKIALPSPQDSFGVMVGVMICSTMIGIAVHLLIEKPMGRAITVRLKRRVESHAKASDALMAAPIKPSMLVTPTS